MSYKKINVKRIAMDAVLIAIYVVMGFLEIPLGGLKISFSALSVIICGLAFGPADGLIVGLLSEFLCQLLSYGLTITTPLWIAPAAVRGLFIGSMVRLMSKHLSPDGLSEMHNIALFYGISMMSGLIVSCLNTLTFYVDSKIYGYYSYAIVFGVFWGRVALGLISSLLMGVVAVPVVNALRLAHLI